MQPKHHLKGVLKTPKKLSNEGLEKIQQNRINTRNHDHFFCTNMNNCKAKKRVSLEVSRGLHEKIKKLANEREETMVSLVISALHEFLESEHDIIFEGESSSKTNSQLNTYRFNSQSITIA